MSSRYSEEYFREVVLLSIIPSIVNGRLDLNNISVDESNHIPPEDLNWAIQTMESNGLVARIDDFNYDLTEAGVSYLPTLIPAEPVTQSQTPEQEPETPAVAPATTAPIPPAPTFKKHSAAPAAVPPPTESSDERTNALIHLIYESFIYNKTLDLTEFGPLILRDHKPDVYGKYNFTDEEINVALSEKVRQGILFLRNVAEDGLDGGQDSYQIISQPDQAINPDDYIPSDLRDKFFDLRDDFAASTALEQKMTSSDMRSQYKAERSELFLMTDLPLDTVRSKEIMAKYAVIADFASTMPEDLQKEYYSRAARIYREHHRPNYLTTADEKIEIEVQRIAAFDALNQKFIVRRDEALRELEELRQKDEAKKGKIGYKLAHLAPGIGDIKNMFNRIKPQKKDSATDSASAPPASTEEKK